MTPDARFTHLVIGGGSAGCVLARRLGERPGNRVLLLEAGGSDRHPLIDMPFGFGAITHDPAFSWLFDSEPEPALGGRRVRLPRGRRLGGSSAINGMLYVRGQHEDYDDWAALGATGWAAQDVLPWFRRAEDQARGADPWHGTGGPLHVSDVAMRDPLSDAIIAAAAATGLPRNPDFNGASQLGVGYFQANIRDGRRWSSARAYLRGWGGLGRSVEVVTGALVSRVLFDGERRAIGAEYRRGGRLHEVRISGEVIIAAGAFQSPALLQASGVGEGALLQALGIPVVADRSAVGANLHDHFGVPMMWRLRAAAPSFNARLGGLGLLGSLLRYLTTRRGIMALPLAQVGAFAALTPGATRPDVQFHLLPLSGDVQKEVDNVKQEIDRFPGMTICPCAVRPTSRGKVWITSADTAVAPAIRLNYLDTPEDRALTLAALRYAQRIAAAEPLAEWMEGPSTPGPEVRSDDELMAYARRVGLTLHHPVGSCRMGADAAAVVDPELRVRGVSGLRVIDASVMPQITSGNTHAPTVMIAERGAALISGD
jgi:choline dehydrogenase